MQNGEIEKFYSVAKHFVTEASTLIKKRFNSGFDTRQKSDSSLVTAVDLEIEQLMRERINASFPEHGIIGEENPPYNSGASHVWVLDPIDGTQSFVHGVPTFGSIVALMRDGEPVVGFIDHPILAEQYSAGLGLGCFCNDTKIKIRDSADSQQIDTNEIITLCSKRQWEISNQSRLFDKLWDKHNFYRIYYDCFALSRAISGQTGAAIEMNVNLWDIAPCKLMVEEAGGKYINLGTLKSADGNERHSALFGKASVTRHIEQWLKEG